MKKLEIHFKNVYTTKSHKNILIIYNISAKHFIGIELIKEKEKNLNYLKSINFYYNIENIKEYKYNEFTNALYIKGKPVKIKDNEFLYFYNLKKVTIESGVKIIGTTSFAMCGSLKEIVFPDSVEEIGDRAFLGCDSLLAKTPSLVISNKPAVSKSSRPIG